MYFLDYMNQKNDSSQHYTLFTYNKIDNPKTYSMYISYTEGLEDERGSFF